MSDPHRVSQVSGSATARVAPLSNRPAGAPLRSDFSKPGADIAIEADTWIARDTELRARQQDCIEMLAAAPARTHCLLCGTPLRAGIGFRHRAVDYRRCGACDHVQAAVVPPGGYPDLGENGAGFERVYPRLDRAAYISRRDRIYGPKLERALGRSAGAG